MRTRTSRPLELLFAAVLLSGCSDQPLQIDPDGMGSSTSGTTGLPPVTTTGTSSASSGVVDDTGTSAGTTETAGSQDCCAPHSAIGCDDPDLTDCVCNENAFCCAFSWDQTCVDQAVLCGGCGPETTTGETTGGPEPVCCMASDMPGCPEDPALEGCVCALDAFCCDELWDEQCVQLAQNDCGAECPPVGGGGDCCMANGSPGCEDATVQDCVCAIDGYCCDNEWDGICVNETQYACMTDCGLPPANEGDCCSATPGPGCDDPMVTECACLIDNDCCLFPWDGSCIQLAVTSCGIMCPGVDPLPPCCLPQMAPGCSDATVQDCVCAFDAFCCDTEWDGQCVNEAQMDCMLDCGGGGGGFPPGTGDCCMPNGTPGCDIPSVQDCVCAIDAFCCDTQWDDICVGEAENDCGGCMGAGTGTGGSTT